MKKSTLVIGGAVAALMMAASSAALAQSWADSITVGGRVYLDVSNNSLEVNGTKSGAKNGNGFDVKRVYVQFDKKFNDIYSVQVQTDVSPVSGIGNSLYIKKAYFKAAFNPAFEVSVGANEMPWVPYAESIQGQRYLENTLLEQNNTGTRGGGNTFGTSADWGVHVAGKIPGDIFSYQVSVVNGKGYRDSARSKGMDVEARLSAKIDQWNFAIGAYDGKRGNAVYNTATITTPALTVAPYTPAVYTESEVKAPHAAKRFNALAAFVGDRTKVGVEYFSATDWQASSITDTTVGHTKGDKADGASVFGSYRVTPQYMLFARYDDVKPSKTLNPNNKSTYYNLGVQTSPLKGIILSAVLKHDVADAYAGGTAFKGARTRTEFTEIGVFSELRF